MGTTNQYTAHTAEGCKTSPNVASDMTVSEASATMGGTDCGPSPNNSGCAFLDTNKDSYGAGLNAGGGAVLATEWTENGIKICKFLHIRLRQTEI